MQTPSHRYFCCRWSIQRLLLLCVAPQRWLDALMTVLSLFRTHMGEKKVDIWLDFLLSFCLSSTIFFKVVLCKDSQRTASASEAVLNLRYTQVNNDQYARGMTKHTTAVQRGFLSVFIHVITEMTKLASLVLYFDFKLDNILNVTLVSFCLFFFFSLDSCNICKLWSV